MGSEKGTVLIAIIMASSFMILVCVYFFYTIFRQQKRFFNLERAKLNQEIEASEKERIAIATELHNDIAPYLTSINFILGKIENEQNREQITKCNETLSHCISHIRVLTKELSPIKLYQYNFHAGISSYINDYKFKDQLEIELKVDDYFDLTEDQDNHIFRILQEIILNTVKHAKATKLVIEAIKEKDFLLIRTVDDGIGFDSMQMKLKKDRGQGLMAIQSRVAYLNGVINTNNSNKSGTQFNIRIPFNKTL
jgi:signal transduction histidine kinase